MQTREKVLAGVFAGVVGVWWVVPAVWSTVRTPVTERETVYKSLKRQADRKENDELKTMAAIKKIADWKRRALTEDALTAQRVYQAWLTELATKSGWKDLVVVPGNNRAVDPGTSVSVKVEGTATAAELAEFLKRFEQSGLLHSIEQSTFTSSSDSPDAAMEVTVTATALSLPDGGPTPLPYAEFELTEATDDATAVALSPSLGAVDEPFDVAAVIDNKKRVATVKKVDKEGRLVLAWDGEVPESLPAGLKMTTEPLTEPINTSVWDSLAKAGPFAVPRDDATPVVVSNEPQKENKPPEIGELEGTSLYPGQPWSLTLAGTDPDGDDDKIRFALSEPVPGASIVDGVLNYTPTRETIEGDVTLAVAATDESGATASRSVTVRVMADPEQNFRFVGSVRIDDEPAAWFMNPATGERVVKRVGDEFVAGRFEGRIDEIGNTTVHFVSADATSRLSLGDRLVERQSSPKVIEVPAEAAADE